MLGRSVCLPMLFEIIIAEEVAASLVSRLLPHSGTHVHAYPLLCSPRTTSSLSHLTSTCSLSSYGSISYLRHRISETGQPPLLPPLPQCLQRLACWGPHPECLCSPKLPQCNLRRSSQVSRSKTPLQLGRLGPKSEFLPLINRSTTGDLFLTSS